MYDMWLLIIKNLNPSEVKDLFDEGLEYEVVRGEIHIQYCRKKYLLEDLRHAKSISLKPIRHEIVRMKIKPIN